MSDAGDRLARSRLAIIEQLHGRDKSRGREKQESHRAQSTGGNEQPRSHAAQEPSDEEPEGFSGWFDSVKHAVETWWRHHPASMGVELASPLLSSYARRKPVQFLGIAAALGVVVVVARPWRLITIGGLLAALLKSSQVSGLLVSAFSAANFQKDHQQPYK